MTVRLRSTTWRRGRRAGGIGTDLLGHARARSAAELAAGGIVAVVSAKVLMVLTALTTTVWETARPVRPLDPGAMLRWEAIPR